MDGVVGPETSRTLRRATRPRAPRGTGRRIAVSLRRQLAFLVGGRGRVVRTLSVSTGKAGYTPALARLLFRAQRPCSRHQRAKMSWFRPAELSR